MIEGDARAFQSLLKMQQKFKYLTSAVAFVAKQI